MNLFHYQKGAMSIKLYVKNNFSYVNIHTCLRHTDIIFFHPLKISENLLLWTFFCTMMKSSKKSVKSWQQVSKDDNIENRSHTKNYLKQEALFRQG